jgi:hypothetical protein
MAGVPVAIPVSSDDDSRRYQTSRDVAIAQASRDWLASKAGKKAVQEAVDRAVLKFINGKEGQRAIHDAATAAAKQYVERSAAGSVDSLIRERMRAEMEPQVAHWAKDAKKRFTKLVDGEVAAIRPQVKALASESVAQAVDVQVQARVAVLLRESPELQMLLEDQLKEVRVTRMRVPPGGQQQELCYQSSAHCPPRYRHATTGASHYHAGCSGGA